MRNRLRVRRERIGASRTGDVDAAAAFLWDWIRDMRHGFWGGADPQMATMPADFLVGPDGRLQLVHYGRTIGDHVPLARLELALAGRPTRAANTSPDVVPFLPWKS